MINRLVKKEYVNRAEDPSDRRVVLCEITDSGRTVLDSFSRLGTVQVEAVASSLTDEELNTIAPALDTLVDAMAKQTPLFSNHDHHEDRRGPSRSGSTRSD
jgi:DNA-binding MarR family transcriptional regulator